LESQKRGVSIVKVLVVVVVYIIYLYKSIIVL
jgi:hypothetical protein